MRARRRCGGHAVSSRRATQLLVRLDGHIGYRGAGTELTGLGMYLDRWLPRP
ncbi:hypothetical protein [Cryobacterium tagatosivorans]|uniref:hypothetical protein n=1 Tax=Cryobacterium tagatosivorans TaxID=1259199 RepID=UPI0018E0BC4A|nr:hypothetical protein [Cryobacterium tagatosivorans]